jgi:hypothetical protein
MPDDEVADDPTPLYPQPEADQKLTCNLEKDGDNWIGLYLMDKNKEWSYFKWYKVFKDDKLKLTADKYTIPPGGTAVIESYLESGIDFPDPKWTVDHDPINFTGKTFSFSSEESGSHIIEATYSPYSIEGSITIEVDPDYEEEYPLIEEGQENRADGTYSCTFWLLDYNATPWNDIKGDVWYSSEQYIEIAKTNADQANIDHGDLIGTPTIDRDNFGVNIHDNGKCDVYFSDFLGFNLAIDGASALDFNGGNIHFVTEDRGMKYDGTISISLTDEGAEMEGKVTRTLNENQFMYLEKSTYHFEGVKLN